MRERRCCGVKVVLADEHDRRALHGGEIHRLVEPAMIDGAVTEEGDRDVVLAARAGADAGTDGMADPGGDDAVRPEQADASVVEMHGAAAPAAASVALDRRARPSALRGDTPLAKRVAVPAMRGRDPVGRPEMRAYADSGRLLADVEMQEAGRLALAAGDLRGAFETPQEHHLSRRGRAVRWLSSPSGSCPLIFVFGLLTDLGMLFSAVASFGAARRCSYYYNSMPNPRALVLPIDGRAGRGSKRMEIDLAEQFVLILADDGPFAGPLEAELLRCGATVTIRDPAMIDLMSR